MRFLLTLLLFTGGSFLSVLPVCAQQAQAIFGKNRIQNKNFNWRYLSSFNFDIYYYDGGEDLAKAAANYAEADFQKIEDKIGFTPYTKIKLLVYNSTEDMQQSNIGLEDQEPVVGGQTHFVKSKIEVSFQGSHSQFRKDIRFSVAEMIINIMLYGGSLKDIVQSSYLLSLPDWYVKGAAAYIAEGWSTEMDNYVREMFLSGEIKKPSHLTGQKAIYAGQSIWNYINEEYGKSNMGSILNLTRVMRNEEASIESSLGVPYSVFVRKWKTYYTSMSGEVKNKFEEVPNEARLQKNRKGHHVKNIQFSPDGKNVSYVESYKGKFNLVVAKTEHLKKKDKTIYKTGQRLIHSEEDPLKITHAWHTEGRLAFIEKRKGKNYLVFVDYPQKKKTRKIMKDFTQVHSFSFSTDGNSMVVSADRGGQTDIYLYDFKNNSYKQVTNDLFDDLNPVFLKNSQQIAFSSNRFSDTLSVSKKKFEASLNNFNIFIYDGASSKKHILLRITETDNNINPEYIGNEKLFYLSDKQGVYNLYGYDLNTGTTSQVSNFLYNIQDYALRYPEGLALVSLKNARQVPFLLPDFKPQVIHLPASTERKRLIDGISGMTTKDSTTFYFESTKKKSEEKVEEEFNINVFLFESDVKKSNKKTVSDSTAPEENKIRLEGPYPYRNLFGVERVNSTLMIDPLRGLGILMEADMSDMMGNHRMKAGLFGLTDLKSSSVFGEYFYLKKRVDFGVRYDRKTIFAFNETISHRYTLNRGAITFSYPLTNSLRISASPFLVVTRFTDMNNFSSFDNVIDYRGLRGEMVFDNTVLKGMNMIEGTRLRFSVDQFMSDTRSRSFGKLIFDLRHYQPLHKEVLLATRISFGQFFGKARKNFLLGGMDNWLFNSTADQGPDDPLNIGVNENSDILFVEYVTNMRGFEYNSQFGPKYVLFNAELRVPVIRYLYNGVIHSNFLKNFQLAAFTDIGSAWSGSHPFNRDNSTNTKFVGGGTSPFSARVVNYRNPFLIGYGAGVRTLFLGYYMKFDVAWGVVNYKVAGKKFYLTLGYDF